jgi:hypothetical protein
MLRRIMGSVCVLVMAMGVAWAGDAPKQAAATGKATADAATKMQAMKDAMAKCAVCKTMVKHMDEYGPITTSEIVKLDNGIAMVHSINDPKKVAAYQAVCKEVQTAGQACMTMTDEQAKTQLCEICQEIRSAVKSGAQISNGNTKTGTMMVLASNDPAVQAKIANFGAKCAMMAEM